MVNEMKEKKKSAGWINKREFYVIATQTVPVRAVIEAGTRDEAIRIAKESRDVEWKELWGAAGKLRLQFVEEA